MLLYYLSHTLRSFGISSVLDRWLVTIRKKKSYQEPTLQRWVFQMLPILLFLICIVGEGEC